MTRKGPWLAGLTLTALLPGVAAAQQEPPPGYENPPAANQPPPSGYQQPPPGYAPPPGYQQQQPGYQQPPPGYQQPPPGYAPPPVYQAPPVRTEPEEPRFGRGGQLVMSDDLQLYAYSRKSTTPSTIGEDTTSEDTVIAFQPALDVFVASNFSLGGQVIIALQSFDGGSVSEFGVMPRLGFNIPLGPKVSIWPRLAAGYVASSFNQDGISEASSRYVFQVQAFAPVLFHPVPHFFFGVGPLLYSQLVAKEDESDATRFSSFGVQSTVGGYLGGR